ncbi:uncharacterized protein [Phyllobates terribilis]|uniref:uncharacterized protein n=1 Tax=Phyllobates terribilis TaxID=111132 RepID=UPI003CCB3117
MYLKARMLSWQDKASELFKPGTAGIFNSTHVDHKELFKKYKNLLQKKTRIWWTKASLDNYHKQKIVPRGLRIQLFPTFGLEDAELNKKWEAAASSCSLTFIEIINERNLNVLGEIDHELDQVHKQMLKDIPAEMLEEFLADMDKKMEKWEENISKSKSKKYQRDISDYENKRVFRWQYRKADDKNILLRNSSTSSISSVASSTVSGLEHETQNGRPSRTRFGGKNTFRDYDGPNHNQKRCNQPK